MNDTFDYIVVGAGSAGCVLANRLSADSGNRVLLIEAGPEDGDFLISMPKGFGKLLTDPRRTWFYEVEPAAGSNANAEVWARGKMLGGSSSINGMVYMRGHPRDYDEWADMGLKEWGWKHIAPHFRQIEDHELGEDELRGSGGPVGVTVADTGSPAVEAFVEAAGEMGLRYRKDLNRPEQLGIGPISANIKDGRRQSASVAFLKPARQRDNLTIVTETLADRLVIENGSTTGVECVSRGERRTFNCSREVVLSAGALNSPQVLQRSGIGDADHLKSLGIDPVANSPQVGRNLREHRLMFLQYRLKQLKSQNREYAGWRLIRNLSQYLLFRRGVMAECSYLAGGFARTGVNQDDPRPDIQLMMAPYSLDMNDMSRFESHHGIQFFGYVLRPTSQGSVRIRSADPGENPSIVANYFATDHDRETGVAMVRFMRELVARPAMRSLLAEETTPGPQVQTEQEILDAYAQLGQAGYHACGTCRMGVDGEAVLDERLRVRGVRGLRVMDLSVLPSMISGNTNAPMMAMASRAAELILSD